ncbi:hypothetical protein N665_2162s0004 [Sinapis alba]|nr:hypothetical protein N665_2162s0004 [Sinapis alba]
MATSAKFRLKLLIDEKRNKVVLAEADQDLVDVLISLLSLPMVKIARLLENHKDLQTVLACYQNLNRSVSDMGIEHFETEACKMKMIHAAGPMNTAILTPQDVDVEKKIKLEKRLEIVQMECLSKCRSSFIVTDDLKVSVNSIGVIMNVLNDLGYLDFSDLQETLLDIGFEEVVTLLGCFFTSETPLTCAFLRKPRMTRNLKMLPTHVQNNVEPRDIKFFKSKFEIQTKFNIS